jgi:hypothetical protein
VPGAESHTIALVAVAGSQRYSLGTWTVAQVLEAEAVDKFARIRFVAVWRRTAEADSAAFAWTPDELRNLWRKAWGAFDPALALDVWYIAAQIGLRGLSTRASRYTRRNLYRC